MRKLLMVLVLFGMAGCSNKEIYDKFRLDERNKCVKEPPLTYFECIERTNKSYEEYERERKEISETQKRIDAGGFQKKYENHKE
jgi:hypothetical protein